MPQSERLHALDAVRAAALLAGVAFHALFPWLEDAPNNNGGIPEGPSSVAAAIFFFLHMFRVPVFFLIAGYFGRLLLERRGTNAFVKDRAKRIAVPLAVGAIFFPVATVVAFLLGSLASGMSVDELMALWQTPTDQQTQPPAGGAGAATSFHFGHLWFLYYLIMFYIVALAVRAAMSAKIKSGIDNALRFLMSTGLAAPVFGLPVAAAYVFMWPEWSAWTGLPTSASIIPHIPTLLTFGLFFAVGWLLHRQPDSLLQLRERWVPYLIVAIPLAITAYLIAGPTPRWLPHLSGVRLQIYAAAYLLVSWCASFALIGLAQRFLSSPSPARRYVAEASYWIYLAHLTVVVFFLQLLHRFDLHWSIKYVITLAFSVPLLLLSYHIFVRHTFIGAILNGRRHPRKRGKRLSANASP
jgi:glucans biosynthesis protein C